MIGTMVHRSCGSGTRIRMVRGALLLVIALVPAALATRPAEAQSFTVLYNFTGGTDGGYPNAVVRDVAGNLYGTASGGGPGSCAGGCGVVFKLDTTGKETVLYTFAGGTDGAHPYGSLVWDSAGNFYGTTADGGSFGYGVVFKLDRTGKETVLHSFAGYPTDGAYPEAGLVRDSAGNLYGTTADGGASDVGVVFKVDTSGTETVLYSFAGSLADGAGPRTGLVRDSAGNLYGTAYSGGSNACIMGCGVVFKLDTTGTATVLYSFDAGKTGYNPYGALLRSPAGTLWGTTQFGGSAACLGGCGVVFRLGTSGKETVLHSFAGYPADGANPQAGLVRDATGNLYGTTNGGGASNAGVVFKLETTGTETVLHSFTGADGDQPQAGLDRDSAGNLYGTTSGGGTHGYGVVFKLTP